MTQDKVLAVLTNAGEPVNVARIVEETELGKTTVRTHLKALIDAGQVVKENGEYRLFVEGDVTKGQMRVIAQGRDAAVLEFLSAQAEGATRAEVAEAIGETTSLAYISLWRLAKAEKAKLVKGEGRSPLWHAV